ncbi:MAG: flippase [Microcoleaceae cyanobacterium]
MFGQLNSIFKTGISPNLSKILGNVGWLLAERVLRMAVGFLVLAWMARYLGAEQFGLLNYALAFVSVFTTLSDLGLRHNIVIRDLVNQPDRKHEILGTVFLIQLLGGIVCMGLAILSIFWIRSDDSVSQLLVIIVAGTLLLNQSRVIDFWFQSQVQVKYSVLARNFAFLIVTATRVVLIQHQAPLIAFGFVVLAESCLNLVCLFFAYQFTGHRIQQWRFDRPRAHELLKLGWPLIFSGLAISIYLRVDQIMLGQLADDTAVGVYSVVVRLSEVWLFVALAIVRSLTPSIVEAKKISETVYYDKLQKIASLLVLVAYVVIIPVSLFANSLVTLVFGEGYQAAGIVLAIHIWSAAFVFLGYLKGVWIATESLTQFALLSSVIGALINIGLNYWLIPLYQSTGAAIATVISYCFADYLICFFYPPSRRMGWIMTKAFILSRR